MALFQNVTSGSNSKYHLAQIQVDIHIIAMALVLGRDLANGYQRSPVYVEEQRQMQRQLTMQVEHLRQIN